MRRPRCSPRHDRHCSAAHARLVSEYRDARDAVIALRSSGTMVPAAYAYGANVAYYQLEGSDLYSAAPLPRFKDWLVGQRER